MTVWWILHHSIQYIKKCLVKLLSNYNIKYICTIYTRLNTRLMSISRFSLRDKVTLRLLKLYFYIANVTDWSRTLDIRLSELCYSVSMVWVQIPSMEEQNLSERYSSNTVCFNLIYIDVVEWSRALDVRLSEWCCSVTMVWVQIPSREEQKFDSSKI